MKVVRAGWTSASFLVYAGALIALAGAFAWLGVISAEHGKGTFAGWTVLFWAVAEAVALWLLQRDRKLAAGLAAFVGLGMFAVMVGAFFSWWGWLNTDDHPFGGFHWGTLGLELIVLLAAFIDLKIWRFPLLVLIAAPLSWYFVTDVVSSGGNWTTVVTLLVGFLFFFVGLGLDGGESRPYGFWVHVTAGFLIGGAFVTWWHSSDAQWAGIIIVALTFILIAAGIRRSSYAVLGVGGLAAATGHYAGPEAVGSVLGGSPPTTWALPVAYLCLGVFIALVGMLLYGRRAETEAS